MADDFDPSNAVAVMESPEGNHPVERVFNIDNAVPVDASDAGETPYDAFKMASNASLSPDGQERPKLPASDKSASTGPLNAKEGQPGRESHGASGSWPKDDFLNAVVGSAQGASWQMVDKAMLGKKDPEKDQYYADLASRHPIANVIGGSAPFIATSVVFPEALIPSIWARLAVQFGGVGFLNALGKVRSEESKRSVIQKTGTVAIETAESAAAGPVFAKAQLLKIAERPFVTMLAQLGFIVGGVGALDTAISGLENLAHGDKDYMHAVFGDNVVEAFKQSGILGVVNLAFHVPHLLKTVIGRGAAAKMSEVSGVKIDPDASPEVVQKQINEAADVIDKQNPKISEPHIISATVKLPDGTEIHGVSHDDALNKIGGKENSIEKLPVKGVPNIAGEQGMLDVLIKEPNTPDSVSLYGKEKVKSTQGNIEKLSGDFGSWRYIYRNDKGEIIGAVQGVSKGKEKILSNIFVKENERRKGIATQLINLVKKNMKGIEVSNQFTELGAEFFKVKPRIYEAGFTVIDPNGKTRFITREESKQPPFNLPNGISEDVQGLNESKFMAQPEPLKIVNPETLKMLGTEAGKMDVNMIPGVAETAEVLTRSTAELKEKLRPYSIGQEGKYTAEVLREQLGILARANDRTEQAFAGAKKFFDQASEKSIIETYTKAERGEKQDSPELQKIYDALQQTLKDEADNVRALGTGKLEEVIENYLPHVWESPKKAANILGQIFGRRPFEGPKSFLKKRTINDFAAGIEAGLTPVSWNPVDLTMLKLREMRKYVMAQRTKEALKQQGIRQFVKVGQHAPDGWKKINDNAEEVYKSPKIPVSEYVDEGKYNTLLGVAEKIGVTHERVMKMRMLGLAYKGSSHTKTKFATDMGVLTHEIGHQIDWKYGLSDEFVKDKNLKIEIRALSDLRYAGKEVSDYFKKYVRKGAEKMANMVDAYVNAPELFKKTAPLTFDKFDKFIEDHPEFHPLRDLESNLQNKKMTGTVDAGGMVISGHYYTHPDAARIVDNYLSPGLAGKSYIYDLYRGAGNTLNQFQLGISAFHLGFTSMDATISKFALGINKLSNGNFAGAIKEFGAAPFAPITNILQGRELLQSWYGKDNGQLTNTIADLMASAGGRAKMDKFYATGAKESMQKALKEGKILTGAMKVPFYIVEQVARPIMEYIVPRQKLGVFMDMMKMELERNPNISHEQLRGIAQRAWNSVDNRMGQMVYDNLFWNKTVKDLGMASVRSLGWNLGTIREIGGGVKDIFGNAQDVIRGKGTKLSYRTAYVMALPIVTGLYGAIYQYLHTGQGPQELKDYFFPKNGGVDNKGQEARISFPTYMKDLYHYRTNPVQTIINKFSPVNNTVLEMLANKDFYGTEIRNMDDPIMQQVLDEAKFVGTQFIPFGFRNQRRDTRKSIVSKVEPFIGITPAPYDVNMTKAERVASEINREKGKFTRSKEQAKHAQEKSKLRSEYMASKEVAPLTEAVTKGVITPQEKKQIIRESRMSRLERATHHLSFEEVQHVFKAATEEEKPELKKIIDRKRRNKKQAGTWTSSEEKMYDESFNAE